MLNDACPKYLISDKECVLRAQNGEYDVFRVLYERYYEDIRQYVSYKVRETEDANDIIGQVFCVVIDKINQLNDPSKFRNWLYTIVKQHIALYFRKKKTSKIILADDLPAVSEDEKYELMDKLIQEKLHNPARVSVKSVMCQLTPIEQRVLQLNIEYGFSYVEISKMIGKSEHAVGKLGERARYKFRKMYLQKYRSPVYLIEK
jgi:RNA polymerase sigma-70 factor (ECF subfamily)